jgi:SAM-dependent methyltransferase
MTQAMTEIDGLGRKIDQIVGKVSKACTGIATELAKPLPQNSSRITGFMHEISAHVRDMSALLPQLDRAKAHLSAEAERVAEATGTTAARLPPEWFALRTRADRLRSQMNQWHEVQQLIRAQAPPSRTPLHVAVEDRAGSAVTQSDVSDELFGLLHKILNPLDQNKTAQSHGCFPDIMLSNSAFIEQAHAAYRIFRARRFRHNPRFVDVGCGSGFKMLSAAQFFGRADGIEFDPGYASVARQIMDRTGRPDCTIIETDALTFDAYPDYDIIYFYRPMRDDTLMQQLERKIVDSATPGTILIAPYLGFSARHKSLGCAHVAGQVYLSASSADEAKALRMAAEHIGTSVARRQSPLSSVWEPVLDASYLNGYGIRLSGSFPV